MKVKIYVLTWNDIEGGGGESIEIAFKKLKDAKEYLKKNILELINGEYVNDKDFKREYEENERAYRILEVELR